MVVYILYIGSLLYILILDPYCKTNRRCIYKNELNHPKNNIKISRNMIPIPLSTKIVI